MTTRKTRWLLVGLVCLAAAAVAYAVLQGGPWETYRAAGDKAYHQGNYPEAEKQLAAAEAKRKAEEERRLAAAEAKRKAEEEQRLAATERKAQEPAKTVTPPQADVSERSTQEPAETVTPPQADVSERSTQEPAETVKPPQAGAGNILLEAGKFVERLGEKAIAQLTPKDISEAERVKRMRALLNEAFDVPVIGKFVLGVYWRRATEKQRAEFIELYETIVAHSYAGLFKKYSGEAFTVTKERPVASDGAIVYGSITQAGGPPIPVELRVVRNSHQYKAVDIKVAGVSMPLTHRIEYSSLIRRSGGKVERLLKGLRKKTAALERFVSEQ